MSTYFTPVVVTDRFGQQFVLTEPSFLVASPVGGAKAKIANGPGETMADVLIVLFRNIGAADATVNSDTVRPGEERHFSCGDNGALAAIRYDATGTELLIATAL